LIPDTVNATSGPEHELLRLMSGKAICRKCGVIAAAARSDA
jgi:hypothetical protein